MRADLTFRGSSAQLRAALAACGAEVVERNDPRFPVGLEPLRDPVQRLYVRGSLPDRLRTMVAIVGSRSGSPAGIEVTRAIARGLVRTGIVVVSGGARGLDRAAHEGALDAGGETIAVLGSGIDVDYPRRNRELLAQVARHGAVVSEYPPGVPAQPHRFPLRNRIIAGLARAVVIVEGTATSGSLITCRHALELGREVFAVPGPVTSPLTEASHQLIREGARLVRGAADLLADLGFGDTIGIDGALGTQGALPLLSIAEQQVFDRVIGTILAGDLAAGLEWPISDVVSVLMHLELKGVVRCVGGRYERRIGA